MSHNSARSRSVAIEPRPRLPGVSACHSCAMRYAGIRQLQRQKGEDPKLYAHVSL